MTRPHRWIPKLRSVLVIAIGMLLGALGVVMAIVFGNVEATGEMRKEAREAVLLAEMDSSLQEIAVAVDEWVSVGPSGSEERPLDHEHVRGQLAIFDVAATDLGLLINPDDRVLVDDLERMFADYQEALAALRPSRILGWAMVRKGWTTLAATTGPARGPRMRRRREGDAMPSW